MGASDRRRAWVSRLRPQGEVDLDQAVIPRPIVQDAVARIGADPVRWAMELNSLVVRRIVDTVPALGGSPAAVEMLRRGNGATTLQALFALVKGSAVASPAREATLEGIREFVHRGIPLEEILRGARIGHAATTEAFLQACAELVEPGVAVEEVKAVSGELFTCVDELSDSHDQHLPPGARGVEHQRGCGASRRRPFAAARCRDGGCRRGVAHTRLRPDGGLIKR